MPRRNVLVIGASSGIGLATVGVLIERGDRVVMMSRSEPALAAAADRLDRPGQLAVSAGDVRSDDDVKHAVDLTVERFGRLDAVVLTAQTMAYGRVEDVPRDVFDDVVTTAALGTATVARGVLPRFRAQGSGALVIVNSILGEVATPRMGAYDTAKWAQLGLARVLQLEVRDAPGVDVSIVSPGSTDTPIYTQAANYAGRPGHPPPPVVAPQRVASAIVACLDRPRRHVETNPTNPLIKLGFRLLPAVYDRIVGPLVSRVIFRGDPAPDTAGNVRTPQDAGEAETDGWSMLGRRS